MGLNTDSAGRGGGWFDHSSGATCRQLLHFKQEHTYFCDEGHTWFAKKEIAISNGRVVVYTAIFGRYEGLLPQRRLPGVDYVCFTDMPIKAKPWDVRMVPPPSDDPTRCARKYKILPHTYFSEYDYSIWIDGNYLVVGDVHELIGRTLKSSNLAYFNHQSSIVDARNCVYDEYAAIMKIGQESGSFKDDPEIMQNQMERYRQEGYPAGNGLIFSSVLIRRHHAKDVVATMEQWWSELSNGSRRDQLSFNYAVWKQSFAAHVINENVRDNHCFYQIGIHRKSYRMKMFRYRLRRLFGLVKHQ